MIPDAFESASKARSHLASECWKKEGELLHWFQTCLLQEPKFGNSILLLSGANNGMTGSASQTVEFQHRVNIINLSSDIRVSTHIPQL
jgi:hypothetical protein